ncbi:hypothetical protein BDV12DRAFT_138390 [Aspergillus spectabilis]
MTFSYTIHPLTLPDLHETTSISELAFTEHNTLLYASPLSPESLSKLVSGRASRFSSEKDVFSFKVVDNGSGKIIGSSRWSIHLSDEADEKSVEEVVEGRMSANLPEMKRDVARVVYTAVTVGRRDVLSVPDAAAGNNEGEGKGCVLRKRVELEGLFVHPEYQRRGIARELLQWGLEEAEKLGLEVYLEATPAGRPFYSRCGFETVKVVPTEGREFAVS